MMYFPLLSLSLGEILKNACLNTVLGMGTVFIVLVFISILISLFVYIPKLQRKFAEKKELLLAYISKKQPTLVTEKEADNIPDHKSVQKTNSVIEKTQAKTDDLELIAVITAAIAASTGAPEDSFVVRSIRRRPEDQWTKSF